MRISDWSSDVCSSDLEPRRELRPALQKLDRYIATVETSKHRYFQFLGANIRPDNKLIVVAIADPYVLGILSSQIHVAWALAAGGRLRSEEHTSELQSLMRISYAVFCLKKQK